MVHLYDTKAENVEDRIRELLSSGSGVVIEKYTVAEGEINLTPNKGDPKNIKRYIGGTEAVTEEFLDPGEGDDLPPENRRHRCKLFVYGDRTLLEYNIPESVWRDKGQD